LIFDASQKSRGRPSAQTRGWTPCIATGCASRPTVLSTRLRTVPRRIRCSLPLLGRGERANWLFARLDSAPLPWLDPREVGNRIFDATLLPSCRHPATWTELWPLVHEEIAAFLNKMEERTGIADLAYASGAHLVSRIMDLASQLPHLESIPLERVAEETTEAVQ
jgi:hypothetical protein